MDFKKYKISSVLAQITLYLIVFFFFCIDYAPPQLYNNLEAFKEINSGMNTNREGNS